VFKGLKYSIWLCKRQVSVANSNIQFQYQCGTIFFFSGEMLYI